MSDIPDKVIEQAVEAYEQLEGLAPALEVAVRWAREQERARIAASIRADLRPEEPHLLTLAGPLGEHIAEEGGSCLLEFIGVDEVADAIASWIEALDAAIEGEGETNEHLDR